MIYLSIYLSIYISIYLYQVYIYPSICPVVCTVKRSMSVRWGTLEGKLVVERVGNGTFRYCTLVTVSSGRRANTVLRYGTVRCRTVDGYLALRYGLPGTRYPTVKGYILLRRYGTVRYLTIRFGYCVLLTGHAVRYITVRYGTGLL